MSVNEIAENVSLEDFEDCRGYHQFIGTDTGYLRFVAHTCRFKFSNTYLEFVFKKCVYFSCAQF